MLLRGKPACSQQLYSPKGPFPSDNRDFFPLGPLRHCLHFGQIYSITIHTHSLSCYAFFGPNPPLHRGRYLSMCPKRWKPDFGFRLRRAAKGAGRHLLSLSLLATKMDGSVPFPNKKAFTHSTLSTDFGRSCMSFPRRGHDLV